MKLSKEQVLEKLKEIILSADENLAEKRGDISEDTQILQDLGFNSVELLYMAVVIEDSFNVTLDGVNVWEIKTVGDAVDMIMGLIK